MCLCGVEKAAFVNRVALNCASERCAQKQRFGIGCVFEEPYLTLDLFRSVGASPDPGKAVHTSSPLKPQLSSLSLLQS